MNMRVSIQQWLICSLVLGAMISAVSGAEIDFFQTPADQKPLVTKKSWAGARGTKIAKILFFIAPACSACPEEAAKLERELNRIGLKYQIEGVFVGDPPQVGKYFSSLRTYPFHIRTRTGHGWQDNEAPRGENIPICGRRSRR